MHARARLQLLLSLLLSFICGRSTPLEPLDQPNKAAQSRLSGLQQQLAAGRVRLRGNEQKIAALQQQIEKLRPEFNARRR